eukprot:GGOE01000054.1.p1 GENE.GGOE01000054.1~~GGOE01000054.1.p1  ORF type:complete len:893 (+),score=256.80 GGOE01000054.1:92-2680(+)
MAARRSDPQRDASTLPHSHPPQHTSQPDSNGINSSPRIVRFSTEPPPLHHFNVDVEVASEDSDSETPPANAPSIKHPRVLSFPPAEASQESIPVIGRLSLNSFAVGLSDILKVATNNSLTRAEVVELTETVSIPRDQEPHEEEGTTEASIEGTFLHMQIRKVQRRCGGKVKESGLTRSFWFVVILSLFIGCGVLSYNNSGESFLNLELGFFNPMTVEDNWALVLFIIVTILTLYVVAKTMVLVRILIMWGGIAIMVLLWLLGKPLTSIALFSNSCPANTVVAVSTCPAHAYPCELTVNGTTTCVATESTLVQKIILFFLLALELATLVVWFYSHLLYTFLVKSGRLTAKGWWKLRAYPNFPNTYTFWTHCDFPHLIRSRHTCQYRGELNAEGRPHGWGQWIDDSSHGERLNGWWEDGLPRGPFVSREYRSGYAFNCVRVGFAMARQDPWDATWFFPKRAPLRVGVAAVECSTSGRFFRFFPASQIVYPDFPEEPQHIPIEEGQTNWVNTLLQRMHHFRDEETVNSVVVRAEGGRSLFISGHYPDGRVDGSKRQATISVQPSAQGSTDGRRGFTEGTLKIDGWLPLHLRSEFAVLLYFPGYNNSCQYSTELFSQLLTLGDFPAHISPWVYSYPAGQIFSYPYAKAEAEDPYTAQRVRELLEAFRDAGCRQVHVMTHSMGARAWLTHVLEVASLFSPEGMQLATCTMLNPDYPKQRFRQETFKALRAVCNCITLYADARDGALKWSERMNRSGRMLKDNEPSLGLAVFGMFEPRNLEPGAASPMENNPFFDRCEWLDLDVIDTTWIENNVQDLRHSYWNINRELVEDLRELVVTQRRARDRSRLAARFGNVYSFLAAPSCLKNA